MTYCIVQCGGRSDAAEGTKMAKLRAEGARFSFFKFWQLPEKFCQQNYSEGAHLSKMQGIGECLSLDLI